MCRKLEKSRSADQPHRALAQIAAQPTLFRRQGAVVGSYRQRNGRTYGPYYRLAWREDGRQCSIYLGASPELVAQVRAALAELQGPLRQARVFRRIEESARRSLRLSKVQTNRHLAPLGLRLQGYEVRGWRNSVFRGLPRSTFIAKMPGLPQPMRIPQLPRTGFPAFPTAATQNSV